MIRLKDINYRYPDGTIALRNINLRIRKGECLAIMGQNGAGKTTLIRLLNGLLRPSSGVVYFDQQDISNQTIASMSTRVGIIFQNPMHQLFSNTVEDEIRFSLKSMNLTKSEIEENVLNTLVKYDFERYKNRSPINLSGGEAKKLAIASIMCRDPEVLVFDEPTLGQDAKEINLFIEMLKSEKRKKKTIIVVTHNIEFAFQYIPRIILMKQGRILADGPSSKLLTNEFLVKNASLIYPQIYSFKLGLKKIGINVPDEIVKDFELIEFLSSYIKNQIES
jgi:energy-coupling factor transporter ATP-binding protein EcfA2